MPDKTPQVEPKFLTPKTLNLEHPAESVLNDYTKWLIGRRSRLQREMNGYLKNNGHLRELHLAYRGHLRKELRMLRELKQKYGLST